MCNYNVYDNESDFLYGWWSHLRLYQVSHKSKCWCGHSGQPVPLVPRLACADHVSVRICHFWTKKNGVWVLQHRSNTHLDSVWCHSINPKKSVDSNHFEKAKEFFVLLGQVGPSRDKPFCHRKNKHLTRLQVKNAKNSMAHQTCSAKH